jgi:hypothetical protein
LKAHPCIIAMILATSEAGQAMAQVPDCRPTQRLADSLAQPYDAAGYAVAASGGVALVAVRGADNGAANAGKVCVFQRNASGWAQVASVAEAIPAANAQFGRSLAMSAGHAVVTAFAANSTGRALAFPRTGAAFGTATPLASPNSVANDRFGEAASVDADWIAVSAPDRAGHGAVDIFTRNGSSWAFHSTIEPPSPSAGMGFGIAISLRGSVLCVGAPGDAANGAEAGAVLVYRLEQSGWTFSQALRAPDGAAGDLFGTSVAFDGPTMVVGAYRDDASTVDSGSAYVFRSTGGTWEYAQKLFPETTVRDADFGFSVAIAGSRIAVGAPSAVAAGGVRAGTTYMYTDNGTTVTPLLRAGSPSSGGTFAGTDVALSATDLVIGAPLDSTNGSYAGGAAAIDLVSDCDNDGRIDAIAIALGAEDLNRDGTPDGCQCVADFNGDGTTSGQDLGIMLGFWGTSASTLPKVDINHDGIVSGADLGLLLSNWGPCQ